MLRSCSSTPHSVTISGSKLFNNSPLWQPYNPASQNETRTQPRLLVSLALIIVLFIFTDVMTLIEDTDNWQGAFFVLVLASVVAINVNGAIFQGGLLGLVGKFPPQYIGGTLTGQG